MTPSLSTCRTHSSTFFAANEGSYLAHTQGKKHQTNLGRRAAKENKEQMLMIQHPMAGGPGGVRKKQFLKIGRPGELTERLREGTRM